MKTLGNLFILYLAICIIEIILIKILFKIFMNKIIRLRESNKIKNKRFLNSISSLEENASSFILDSLLENDLLFIFCMFLLVFTFLLLPYMIVSLFQIAI